MKVDHERMALVEALLSAKSAVAQARNDADRAADLAARATKQCDYAQTFLDEIRARIATIFGAATGDATCALCDDLDAAHPENGHAHESRDGLARKMGRSGPVRETIPHDPAAHLRPVREVYTSPVGARRPKR